MKAKEWDLEISPAASSLRFNFKDIWEYKDLLILFIKRDFSATFKQTILGPTWFFIQPMLTAFTLSIIFGRMANLPSDGIPRMLFYLSGLIGWNYFSECLIKTSDIFVSNQAIFGKVYFPRLIVPLSIVTSNLLKLIVQFLVFLAFWFYYFSKGEVFLPTIGVFYIPLLILLLMGLGLSLGMIFSSLTTKYRDLTFLLGFSVQLLMYATPIIYPASMLSEKYRHLLFFNPLTHIIEALRYALLGKGTLSWNGLFYSSVFLCASSLIGWISFSKIEKNFMDTV